MEKERERAILQEIIKSTIKDIKTIQKEIKDAYTSDDVLYLQGQETVLINQKIKLEHWRKSLKS